MKIITQLFRFIIGALFVFSGFVKLIDPKGSAYKFAEYFGSDVLNMEFLIPYALPFSIFLILAEVMLGVMLLVGYKSKFTTWSLFLMMLLFLFLTFYSAYTNKVTDCGCFGDFLKLNTWPTFYKNLIFTPMIIWLLFKIKDIRPLYSNKLARFISLFSLLIFGFITYYVLQHLPMFDFRPYAIGKNIPAGMIIPKGAQEEVVENTFTYKVNGIIKDYAETEKPWEIKDAVYVDRKTKVITKGYEPPIHDFTMERNGVDLTSQLMQNEKLLLVIAYDISKSNFDAYENIKMITNKALDNGYLVYMMTASPEEQFKSIKKEYQLDFDFLFCDETTLKTIIRSSPGILTLNKGTIVGKWSYNDIDYVKIKEGMGRKAVSLDFNLKQSLDSIFLLDQKYRSIINEENPKIREQLMMKFNIPKDSIDTDFWDKQSKIDITNISFLDKVIQEYGYPGRSLVGELSKDAAASIIMNSNNIDKYIEQIKSAAEKNEMTFSKAATMEDLYLMNKGEEQLYGTQTSYINDKISFWPIKDIEAINIRRKEAGFELTVQEYGKKLFGDDYVFEPTKMDDIKK
ncbi:MAG: BT_3928 family protein [Flavobacteriaceae bacterium]